MPKINSTTNAEKIASNEICKTLVRWTNIFLILDNILQYYSFPVNPNEDSKQQIRTDQ